MTKAIGYVRRSTDRQEESLDQQRAKLTEFAKAKGWQLVAVFADDAISGSEMKRPGLDKLLRAITDPAVDVVLAWDRNRLARPKACCSNGNCAARASAWSTRALGKSSTVPSRRTWSASSSITRTATTCGS